MAHVNITGLSVVKDDTLILDDVNLEVFDGELLGILGPSGAGKTTLLRVVAGLDEPVAGSVTLDGVDLFDVPSRERDVAMVFQEAVFFPNLDVGGNVAFPLKIRRRPAEEIATRVGAEMRALHIDSLLRRRPDQLSAGEQHLVQIARSLVRAPRLFLMDEPLARLDAWTRERMRGELRMMQRGYGVTTMYVTNDPREAMALADRIVVINRGRVEQIGTPDDLYRHPVSLGVARLTGELSVVDVQVAEADGGGFDLTAGRLRERAWAPLVGEYVGRTLRLAVRPEAVVWPENDGTPCTAANVATHGGYLTVHCRGDEWVVVARSSDLGLREGDAVRISLADHSLFDPATERIVATSAP